MKRKLKTFIAGILFFMLIAPLFGETKISSERQQFIDYALTLQGTRYVWGGKSPATGLDCSGFVEYAAQKSVKKSVTGTAAMMYKNLEHITPDEREPGDLIFFAVQSNGKYNVTHVGIYLGMYHGKGRLDGERIFVHAASDGKYTGVTVNSINDNYWKKHPRLVVVLCGSVSSWIKDNIIDNGAFVGRRSPDATSGISQAGKKTGG